MHVTLTVFEVFASMYALACLGGGGLLWWVRRRQRLQAEAKAERDRWNEDIDDYLDEVEP